MREARAVPAALANIMRIIVPTLGANKKCTDVHFQWALIGRIFSKHFAKIP